MSEFFDEALSEPMSLADYSTDFRRRRQDPSGPLEVWKIERRQFFSDPDDPPWVAFSEARWDESIRLMESSRPVYLEYYAKLAAEGVTAHRVRVVDEPVGPYVQWEFHYLRIPASMGEKIRVVTTADVRRFEGDSPLPEILVTGTDTVYKVLYSAIGEPVGARRIIHAEVARRCRELTKSLYSMGEDMDDYFAREIKDLTPPQLG